MLELKIGPVLRSAVFVLGTFSFAYNAATALHEFGHVIASRLVGATVHTVSVHPFTTSSVTISADPSPVATHLGGMMLAPAVGCLAALAARNRDGVAAALAFATGILGSATVGVYLVVGTWLDIGDARVLLRADVSGEALLSLGAALVLVAVLLAREGLPRLGIRSADPLPFRIAVLQAGTLPYFIAIAAWNASFEPRSLTVWLSLAAAGSVMAGIISLIPPARTSRNETTTWRDATIASAAGVTAIGLAFWA